MYTSDKIGEKILEIKRTVALLISVSTLVAITSCTSDGKTAVPDDPGDCKEGFCAKEGSLECLGDGTARKKIIFSMPKRDANKPWSYTKTAVAAPGSGGSSITSSEPRTLDGGKSSFGELVESKGNGITTLIAENPDGGKFEFTVKASDCPPVSIS